MQASLNRSWRSSGHFQMTPRTPWLLREMEEMECRTAISLPRRSSECGNIKKKKKKRKAEEDGEVEEVEKSWTEKLGARQSAHVANIPLIIALRQGTLSCLPDDALGRRQSRRSPWRQRGATLFA